MKSDVECKLFQVSLLVSEVDFKMSEESQQTKSQSLTAVGVILSQLENLVLSKLSTHVHSFSVNDDVCDPRSSFDPDSSSCVNDDFDSSSSINDGVCISSSSELWWDNSSYYYHLYYGEEDGDKVLTRSKFEDDTLTESDDEEETFDVSTCREECVIDAPSCREECVIDALTCREECVTDTSRSELMSSTYGPSMDMMTKVLTVMKSLAPSSIYDRKKAMRKRRKKMKKTICRELLSIWTNAATIVSPDNDPKQSTSSSSFPSVDWKNVNKRFLTNIPSPVQLPLHGCSQNPDDYEEKFEKSDYGNLHNIGSKFTRDFPFGSTLGFPTSVGAVGIPDKIFHGYVFEVGQGWILNARFPERKEIQMKKIMKRKKEKTA